MSARQQPAAEIISSYSSFRDEFNIVRSNFDRDNSIDEEHFYINNNDEYGDDDDTKSILNNRAN